MVPKVIECSHNGMYSDKLYYLRKEIELNYEPVTIEKFKLMYNAWF